eukprot:scaffold36661_cov60-Cyclotella_meneghiniana.AAC.1
MKEIPPKLKEIPPKIRNIDMTNANDSGINDVAGPSSWFSGSSCGLGLVGFYRGCKVISCHGGKITGR